MPRKTPTPPAPSSSKPATTSNKLAQCERAGCCHVWEVAVATKLRLVLACRPCAAAMKAANPTVVIHGA